MVEDLGERFDRKSALKAIVKQVGQPLKENLQRQGTTDKALLDPEHFREIVETISNLDVFTIYCLFASLLSFDPSGRENKLKSSAFVQALVREEVRRQPSTTDLDQKMQKSEGNPVYNSLQSSKLEQSKLSNSKDLKKKPTLDSEFMEEEKIGPGDQFMPGEEEDELPQKQPIKKQMTEKEIEKDKKMIKEFLDLYPRISEKSYLDKTLTSACKLVSGDQKKRKEAHR